MSKRYTVTPKQTADGIDYVIFDNLLGADVGFFPTQPWADTIADLMEKKWRKKKDDETKGGKGQESNVREER